MERRMKFSIDMGNYPQKIQSGVKPSYDKIQKEIIAIPRFLISHFTQMHGDFNTISIFC